jgi:mRNA-degrading endonuclease RelE of RelBE toxin-antitoxin system
MRFIETPIFTRQVASLISEDEYRSVQLALLFRPEQGALISGTGGLRKLRWRSSAKGKCGGFRIIYYWEKRQEIIYMLMIYPKSKREDLTHGQARALGKLVREEFK